MRVSDAEREIVAARLGEALESGRLTLTEFDQRSRELYEARTYAEVNRLLEDLPSAALDVPAPEGAAPEPTTRTRSDGKENGMGIAALSTGMISMVNPFPFSILAVVFGAVGLSRVREGRADNRASALAGVLLGAVSASLWLVVIVSGSLFWW